jgi:hypothetical protein
MELQQDDVTFWSERFKDHAMTLFILIDPNRANDLKIIAHQEFQDWDLYLQNPSFEALNQLIPRLSNLKHDVLEFSKITPINLVLSHNDFISLVNHMIEELVFFLRLMSGNMTAEEELDFWKQESAEHTELASHLIPFIPMSYQDADKLTVDSKDVVGRLKSLTDPYALLPIYQWSNQIALKLDKLIQEGDKNAVQDLFHMMVEHEIKEGVRGAIRIRQLTGM